MLFATHNAGRHKPQQQGAHPPPEQPFELLMMDFIELIPARGKKHCLVMVMVSKWVKAFPAKHANSLAVTKALLTEIVPWRGIPIRICSDNGAHFVNAALDELGKFLGIDLKRYCAYHPQSGGAVE